MSIDKKELSNFEEYLINEDLPEGVYYLLKDYLVNETITKDEINKFLSLPTDEFLNFINNYTLKGK